MNNCPMFERKRQHRYSRAAQVFRVVSAGVASGLNDERQEEPRFPSQERRMYILDFLACSSGENGFLALLNKQEVGGKQTVHHSSVMDAGGSSEASLQSQ